VNALLGLALLQAGSITVGDTVRIERLVGPAGGMVVRPQPWNLGGLGQQLGPAEVTTGTEGLMVRYSLVLWYPGDHTLVMPGPVLIDREGRSDTLATSSVVVRVVSVLPGGQRKAAIPPKPATPAVPLEARTPLPLLVALLIVSLAVSLAGWRWRRKGTARSRPPGALTRPGPDVITRWAAAGEYRAALEGWGWILARRLAASSDLAETAALQQVLEEISFGAFAPLPDDRLKALCDRAAGLAAP